MGRRCLLVTLLFFATVAAAGVEAQITETITYRSNSVQACGTLIPMQVCDDPPDEESFVSGDFINLLEAMENTTGTASASADQSTSIVTGFYTGSLAASASADGGTSTIADGTARCEYSVTIELTEATTFEITASGSVSSTGSFTSTLAELVIVETPLGTPFIPVQVTDGAFDITDQVTIGPGDYLITVQVIASSQGQFAASSADADIEFAVTLPGGADEFARGDADANGTVNGLADGLFILAFFFTGGPPPPCLDAADVDDSDDINGLVDALHVLNHFFNGGPPPGAPYPDCGTDPGPGGLGCETPPCP